MAHRVEVIAGPVFRVMLKLGPMWFVHFKCQCGCEREKALIWYDKPSPEEIERERAEGERLLGEEVPA